MNSTLSETDNLFILLHLLLQHFENASSLTKTGCPMLGDRLQMSLLLLYVFIYDILPCRVPKVNLLL